MSISFSKLRSLGVEELVQQARDSGLDNAGNLRHSDLIFELTRLLTDRGQPLIGEGILDILSDGFGFLRSPVSAFAPGADDIYVSPSQIRRFNLRSGDWISGKARAPREGERYFALLQIQSVNGNLPEQERNRLLFDTLSSIVPNDDKVIAFFPEDSIGLGSMGLVDSQCLTGMSSSGHPGFGMAQAIDVDDFVYLGLEVKPAPFHLLRHEKANNVLLTNLGDPAARHIQQCNLAVQRAKRLAEQGKDVALVIDSVTSLARAFRDDAEQQGRNGAISLAIGSIKSVFAVARNVERLGSITVLGVVCPTASPLAARLETDLSTSLDFYLGLKKSI